MRALRDFLRQWLGVPNPVEPWVPPEPKVEYSATELAAFDAAEIVTIYEHGLAAPYTIAELCRAYEREHVKFLWSEHRGSVDVSANQPANRVVLRILADIEVELAKQNLAAAKQRAKEAA